MAYLNKVFLIGRLGKDPVFTNENKIASFTLATSQNYKDKNTGEKKESTEWHNIVCYNESLVNNVIKPYIKKGSLIYLEGSLRTRKWVDKENNDKYTTEVILKSLQMLDTKDKITNNNYNQDTIKNSINPIEQIDDEIPF